MHRKFLILYLVNILLEFVQVHRYEDSLNFFVLGDWGGQPWYPYTTEIEQCVSRRMSKTAEHVKPQFIVALGDNFYYDGVRDVHDKRFEETYSHVFNEENLQIPWYLVAGNHDHHGSVEAQIAYSAHSETWKFLDYWYSKKWTIPGSNSTLKLVMIDTILLCGNSGHDDELDQPQGPENLEVAESQWSWLEEQLKYSRDQYLLVGGHFPVWSVAEHGPTDCLVERLKPLLEKYKVNAYLCGHDHNLQHIREEQSNVHYFVIGAANFVQDNKAHVHSIPDKALQFYWADTSIMGGFSSVTVTPKRMTVDIINANGDVMHTVELYPRSI